MAFSWGGLAKGIGNLFGGGGSGSSQPFQSMAGGTTQKFLNPSQLSQQNNMNGMGGGGGWGGALKGISNMFGGAQGLTGLGMMGASALMPSAKAPSMSPEYQQYYNQLQQGGSPGMQSAQQYYQGVLSGQNQGAYDAAEDSILREQEKARMNLEQTYKSLRPGSDLTNDSSFQKDVAELEANFAKQLALVRSGLQKGAADSMNQQGMQLAQMQGNAASSYNDLANAKWQVAQNKRTGIADMFGGLGSQMISGPIQMAMMKKMFPGWGG